MISLISILLNVPTAPATDASAVDFTWLFLKMLLALGIVSILAVLILKYAVPHIGLMKRFQKGGYFRVLGRYLLEPRRSLYIVEVGGRYLVIGVSDHGINLVTELTQKEAMEGSVDRKMGSMKHEA